MDDTVLASAAVRFALEAPPPMFGDLTFTPTFENIGSSRSVNLVLHNNRDTELRSVLIGLARV